jgi:hypothetical protein
MKGCIEWRLPDIDMMLVGPELVVHDYRAHQAHLRGLAARAVAHCPRDLAEALCLELGIPMPEGFVDTPSALDEWAK